MNNRGARLRRDLVLARLCYRACVSLQIVSWKVQYARPLHNRMRYFAEFKADNFYADSSQ